MEKQLAEIRMLRKKIEHLMEDLAALERAKAAVRNRAARNAIATTIVMTELLKEVE